MHHRSRDLHAGIAHAAQVGGRMMTCILLAAQERCLLRSERPFYQRLLPLTSRGVCKSVKAQEATIEV
jgi:hypothetical protein